MPAPDPYACPCCGVNVIDPSIPRIVEFIGWAIKRILRVSSGTRCIKHNKAVGGAPRSSHLTGQACDVMVGSSRERYKIIKAAMNLGVDRIGVSKSHVHLDIAKKKSSPVMWVE